MANENRLDDLTFSSFYKVMQSGMWLLNDLEQYLNPFGLSQGRLTILLNLQENPGSLLSPNEIALLTGKSKVTITRMVAKLEQQDFIYAMNHPRDGRKKVLTLSPAGRALLDKVVPGYNCRIRMISTNLSENDKKDLLRVLRKIDFPELWRQRNSEC